MNNLVGATCQGWVTLVQQLPNRLDKQPDGTYPEGAWLAAFISVSKMTPDLVGKKIQLYVIDNDSPLPASIDPTTYVPRFMKGESNASL